MTFAKHSPPQAKPARLHAAQIGGMWVNAGTYASTTEQIILWAQRRERRYICVGNVHMVMASRDSESVRRVVDHADHVTADGMPLVWMLHLRGFPKAQRVYGPNLMLAVCRAAAEKGIRVGLFGSTPIGLTRLSAALSDRFPSLPIVAKIAPPFGAFTAAQNRNWIRELNASGAEIIFVGLGCPKQEHWMAEVSGELPAVLIGVGAAFDFHAGTVRQAPAWIQNSGLEWAFRLLMEPRRLWRRYLVLNPRFLTLMLTEEWRRRTKSTEGGETGA